MELLGIWQRPVSVMVDLIEGPQSESGLFDGFSWLMGHGCLICFDRNGSYLRTKPTLCIGSARRKYKNSKMILSSLYSRDYVVRS